MKMVVKANVGELKDEVRELFYRKLRKEFTGVVQVVYGKRMFLVRSQDGCEKDLTSNQIIVMKLYNSPVITYA